MSDGENARVRTERILPGRGSVMAQFGFIVKFTVLGKSTLTNLPPSAFRTLC